MFGEGGGTEGRREGGGNERGGIIHKIVSECVKIKVKIQKESWKEGAEGVEGGGDEWRGSKTRPVQPQ